MNASGLWQSATGLFDAGLRQARQAFGYDAVDTGEGKRRAPSGVTRSEDDELPVQKRRKLLSQTRDLARNFALLGWAIRQHLNYITTFNFQPKTGNRRLNQKLAAFLENWSEPENFDVAGITPLWNFIRLAEVRRCIDGDMLALKLANGQVQAIEGDRLLSPRTAPREIAARNWFHGVELGPYGRHLAYAVHGRGKSNDFGAVGSSQFVFERAVPAYQALLFAHRERFDQVRGITPLTAAINSLVDTQEGIDFISTKLKVHALFGLAVMRGDPNGPADDATQDYTQLILGKRPLILDMDRGERAEFLESRTPATETQAFLELLIQLTLKALDIPYSFFRENFTNYSGQRQALVMYNESAKIKRRSVLWLLNGLTRWRLQLAVIDRQLPQQVLEPWMWQWIPTGVPWIDPLKEVQANAAALALGVTSKTRICAAQGLDYEEILDELVAERKLEEERGLTFDVTTAAQVVTPRSARRKRLKAKTQEGA
jgi:capsid protein